MADRTAAHLEVERTFEVDASTDLPDLRLDGVIDSVPDAALDLVATYHDTPDLRLLAAGITLRRRRGGSDDGWHLKVSQPGAADARLELRRPPGRSPRPPLTIRRLVLGAARGVGLVPVAEVRTHRAERRLTAADGRVLAVLADDLVSTRVLTADGPDATVAPVVWREVEVELVEGDRDLLTAVSRALQDAGISESAVQSKLRRALGEPAPAAPTTGPGDGATAGDVLLAHLRRLRAALVAQDVHVRAHRSDGVHQLRVAARRTRSVLAAYRPLLDESRTRPLEDQLRWAGVELSPARDLEVIGVQLGSLLDREPPDRSTRAARRLVRSHLRRASRDARDQVDAALGSKRYLLLLDDLAGLVAEPPFTEQAARSPRGRLRWRVRKAYRRLGRAMAAADALEGAERDRALHAARKAAKRVRYAVEAAEPVVGKPAGRLRRGAKRLQQALGAHHDSAVLRDLVRDLATDPGPDTDTSTDGGGSAAFTLGRVHARLERRADELDEQALAQWRRLSRRTVVGWLG